MGGAIRREQEDSFDSHVSLESSSPSFYSFSFCFRWDSCNSTVVRSDTGMCDKKVIFILDGVLFACWCHGRHKMDESSDQKLFVLKKNVHNTC
jgi:hypothetical protein